MPLFISERIRKREFGASIPDADRLTLLDGYEHLQLAELIGGKGLPKGTRLLKAYATTERGPRRILYLLVVAEGDAFVLLYRDKGDAVGRNMSPRNSEFAAVLLKHLAFLEADIGSRRIEEVTKPPGAGD